VGGRPEFPGVPNARQAGRYFDKRLRSFEQRALGNIDQGPKLSHMWALRQAT
jgi:hypothetical protein